MSEQTQEQIQARMAAFTKVSRALRDLPKEDAERVLQTVNVLYFGKAV